MEEEKQSLFHNDFTFKILERDREKNRTILTKRKLKQVELKRLRKEDNKIKKYSWTIVTTDQQLDGSNFELE
jgi:ribosomal protein S1